MYCKMKLLRKIFGENTITVNSKKYCYCIYLATNKVSIKCKNWQGCVNSTLHYYCNDNYTYIYGLDPDSFNIRIDRGLLDEITLDVPSSIKEDIISDFTSLMSVEFVKDLCRKEEDRKAKEKELEKKENQKLVNEFFGIMEE